MGKFRKQLSSVVWLGDISKGHKIQLRALMWCSRSVDLANKEMCWTVCFLLLRLVHFNLQFITKACMTR